MLVQSIPIHLAGPNSFFFHTFDIFSQELRDITLFHEMLNKHHKTFQVTVGQPIAPEALDGDVEEVTEAIKTHVERILAPLAGKSASLHISLTLFSTVGGTEMPVVEIHDIPIDVSAVPANFW